MKNIAQGWPSISTTTFLHFCLFMGSTEGPGLFIEGVDAYFKDLL